MFSDVLRCIETSLLILAIIALVIFNILMFFISYLGLLICIAIFNLIFKYIKHYLDFEYCCKNLIRYAMSICNMNNHMIKYCIITHSTNFINIFYFSNHILACVYCKSHMNYFFAEQICLYSLYNLLLLTLLRIYIHVSGYYIRLMFSHILQKFILKKPQYITYLNIFILLYNV